MKRNLFENSFVTECALRWEGGILAPILQELDNFCERNYPFERGSRGEKSKIVIMYVGQIK